MPLNGYTLGQTITDSINQMITISKHIFYSKYGIERHLLLIQSGQFDPINQMILLNVIPISGAQCNTNLWKHDNKMANRIINLINPFNNTP